MSNISTSRITFHLRTQGDPTGLPMLFLHGSFGTGRWWEPVLAYLPQEIYAIAPDLRGCGGSEKPDDGYQVESQAEDLWALVQAMGLREIDLVAHSSSCAIAVEYALRHEVTLNSLTLVSAAPLEGVQTPLEGYRLLDQMQQDIRLLRRALLSLMPGLPQTAAAQDLFEQIVADAAQMAPAAFTGVTRGLERWNRFEEVGRLSLPVLLIWGDQDTIVDQATTMRSLIAIPGANNLEVLRGVGHSPMLETPLGLIERIVEFVTEDFQQFGEIRQKANG